MPELTGPQIAVNVGVGDGELGLGALQEYELQELHRHPTVRLARRLYSGIMASAQWSVEANPNSELDPDVLQMGKDLISRQLLPLRSHFVKSCARGCTMRGWRPFEVVLDTSDPAEWGVKKLKALTHKCTTIRTDENTGAFIGLQQPASGTRSEDVVLEVEDCLLISLDVEGTDWRGEGAYDSAVGPWRAWKKVESAATRYDEKVAGAFWVIHYPLGTSPVNGQPKDNYDIAVELLAALKSSGSLIVPRTVQDTLLEMNEGGSENTAWKIELISDGGSANAQFIPRQKYLDTNIVRAFGFAERAILEGQFGTKAEAGEHADLAITLIEQDLASMIEQLNWHLVNRLLSYNMGPQLANEVYISAEPIVDSDRTFLRSVLSSLLTGPLADEQIDRIDTASIRERLGVPSVPEEEVEPTEPEPVEPVVEETPAVPEITE